MSKTANKSLIVGCIFIALGAIFLLENFNIIPYSFLDYFFNWQGILFAIGVIIVSSNENRKPGFILMAIGGFFIVSDILAYEFGLRWFDAWRLFWPLAIIGAGIIIITRQGKSSKLGASRRQRGDADSINVTAILGGGDVSINSNNFRGGQVTAFMGGGTYDLSNSMLADGVQEIDVFAMFGGATFIVPPDWNVRIEVTPIFGGFSDDRKKTIITATDSTRELVIRGTVIFGGGEVKCKLVS